MANFKQTVRNMTGTKLPPRFAGNKLGVKAPGALAKVPGGLPARPQAGAISPFTVQDAPASYRDLDVPVASFLSGFAVEDEGAIAGLGGMDGILDGTIFGVPKVYLVYGGVAVVALGGLAVFMKRRRRSASPAVSGLASLHRRSRTTKRRRRR
jgi:hypothetical protein